jgi:uridine kinase
MRTPYLVGITGGSASGKTLFLKRLLECFSPEEICLVSQDNYYRPRHEQPIDENGIQNFDMPQSINSEEYGRDVAQLKAGQMVSRKEYTFNNPNVEPATLTFVPAPIIVVEGIFVFHYPEVTRHLDLKVYIDAEEHIKLKRRIIRDRVERGYDLEDVLYRYEKHVAPTYTKFIEPFKNEADVIVPNNSSFERGLKVLVDHLKAKLA